MKKFKTRKRKLICIKWKNVYAVARACVCGDCCAHGHHVFHFRILFVWQNLIFFFKITIFRETFDFVFFVLFVRFNLCVWRIVIVVMRLPKCKDKSLFFSSAHASSHRFRNIFVCGFRLLVIPYSAYESTQNKHFIWNLLVSQELLEYETETFSFRLLSPLPFSHILVSLFSYFHFIFFFFYFVVFIRFVYLSPH